MPLSYTVGVEWVNVMNVLNLNSMKNHNIRLYEKLFLAKTICQPILSTYVLYDIIVIKYIRPWALAIVVVVVVVNEHCVIY